MYKKSIAVTVLSVLILSLLPTAAHSTGFLVFALKFFGTWLAGKILDKAIDKYVLQNHIQDVKQKIIIERQTVVQEVFGPDRQRILQALKDVQNFMDDFDSYISTHTFTDAQLVTYCDSMLHSGLLPLQDRLEKVEQRVSILEEISENHEQRVGDLEVRTENHEHRIDKMESNFNICVLAGGFYQAFRYTDTEWNKRFEFLPFKVEGSNFVHSGGGTIGIWFSRFLHVEGSVHYIPRQKSALMQVEPDSTYEMYVEGLGWSGAALFTLPPRSKVRFEIGAGCICTNYQVDYKLSTESSYGPAYEKDERVRMRDPIAIIGLRFGEKGFFGDIRLETIIYGEIVEGLYLKAGFHAIIF